MSAPVHPGCSGGPVIDMRDGSLIGIMTSFLQCMDDEGELLASFPRLNFAVPTPVLEPLRRWIQRADTAVAQAAGLQEKPLDRRSLAACFNGLHRASAKYWLPSAAAAVGGGGSGSAGGGGVGGGGAGGSGSGPALLPVVHLLQSKL